MVYCTKFLKKAKKDQNQQVGKENNYNLKYFHSIAGEKCQSLIVPSRVFYFIWTARVKC